MLNANFFVQAVILLGLVLIFLLGQSRQRRDFTQVLDSQRRDFVRFLHEQAVTRSGPDTGAAIPSARPPTGPKSPTGGRNVRTPTKLN